MDGYLESDVGEGFEEELECDECETEQPKSEMKKISRKGFYILICYRCYEKRKSNE